VVQLVDTHHPVGVFGAAVAVGQTSQRVVVVSLTLGASSAQVGASVTRLAQFLEVLQDVLNSHFFEALVVVGHLDVSAQVRFRVHGLGLSKLRAAILTEVVNEDHLHVLAAHQAHGLENAIIPLVLVSLLGLNHLLDKIAIFHHLGGCLCGVESEAVWKPVSEDLERDGKHVDLDDWPEEHKWDLGR